jgi:hypothetical protein
MLVLFEIEVAGERLDFGMTGQSYASNPLQITDVINFVKGMVSGFCRKDLAIPITYKKHFSMPPVGRFVDFAANVDSPKRVLAVDDVGVLEMSSRGT